MIRSHLQRIGRPAGDMDVLIAAICLANGQTLATGNPRHFADIPGLVVELRDLQPPRQTEEVDAAQPEQRRGLAAGD